MSPIILFPRVKWAVDSSITTIGEQQTASFIEDKSQAIIKILEYAEQPLKIHSELFLYV